MKKFPILQICLIIIGLLSLPTSAEPVKGLYETIIPVADQSANERIHAMRAGLIKVLVKVTGDSQVSTKIDQRAVLSVAERYVTEYGYVRHQLTEDNQQEPGLGITLSYAESAVNRVLRQYQLQVWPSDRPELLVWVVIDDAVVGKQFATEEEQAELLGALTASMMDRGAPIILPLLDLQDQQALPVASAWNFDMMSLATAAQRYGSDNWLVLRLYQSAQGHWRGSSMLNLTSGTTVDNLSAMDINELLSQVVPKAVDALASQYAYIPKDVSDELLVHIENIGDYQTFNRAVDYLQSLELVDRLKVDYVDEDRLGLRLFVEGDISLLLDSLNRDQRMIALAQFDAPVMGALVNGTRTDGLVIEVESAEAEAVGSEESDRVSSNPLESLDVMPAPIRQYRFRWGEQ